MPLTNNDDEFLQDPYEELYGGNFVGGGAAELMLNRITELTESEAQKSPTTSTKDSSKSSNSDERSEGNETLTEDTSENEKVFSDVEISFDIQSDPMTFARRAYVISEIPASEYVFIHRIESGY